MSLVATRHQETERTSVVLPTITCSSCAAPIPMSSLGEHTCRAPSRQGLASRSAPRPSQIAIPAQHPAPGPSQMPPRAPFAGPSSVQNSPTDLHIPRRPSPASLSPLDASYAYAPPARTPSPTNPFFPRAEQQQGGPVGLGFSQPINSPMPDTTSGGESGMAGVGRRAFAAAAWGVRAGVALASAGRPAAEQPAQESSAQIPPWQQPRSEPTPREPPIMPKAPLANRQRNEFQSRPPLRHANTAPMSPPTAFPASPPQRSASSMSQHSAPQPVSPPRRKESTSSLGSSHTSDRGDSIAQLLRGRNASGSGVEQSQTRSNKPGFFDKVKELNNRSETSSPVMGLGMTRSTSADARDDGLVDSPDQTTFELDDEFDDDQGSALPWATPQPDVEVQQVSMPTSRTHQRYHTAGSEVSSSSSASSSARSGRWGANGPETEEVITPSQSWEGLSDRANGVNQNDDTPIKSYGDLDQIGEEDEDEDGERVIFGTPTARTLGTDVRLPHSASASTITPARPYKPTMVPYPSPNRSKTMPVVEKRVSTSKSTTSSSTSERRRKTCQKCGEYVGGSKRFVERDGVVLCEKDWKKLYLPSCRRCNLPIEKSAVSSSDGQLKGKWHRACFTCTRCDKPFEGDSFYVHAGKPWCQHHYHEENGTLCASSSCRQPIEGSCILTTGTNPQRFHPGHLRCEHRGGVSGSQSCREAMDEYYDVAGMRYCERHVGEALRREGGSGGTGGMGGMGRKGLRAEKRRTRLVDLPVGGF